MSFFSQAARNIVGAGCVSLLLFFGREVFADTPPPEATNLWKFAFQSGLNYNSSRSTPAIATDGTIYLGSFDGTFYAVTPAGRERWRFKAGREIKSSPALADDGTIYFGSRDRKLYALTPAGKLKWSFATGAWIDSSPAIAADGTIYFGSWDTNFYAVNPNGSLKWKFPAGGIVDSSPAIAADGTIYFGSHDKLFYALNPDGTVRWKFLTGAPIVGSPALGAAGEIYFTSLDGNFYALNPDGKEQWRYHTGGATEASPVLDEKGNIYVPANNFTLSLSKTGQRRGVWPSALFLEVPPVIVTGRVYGSRPWRTLNGITEDLQFLWLANFTENVTAAPVVDARGLIYICADQKLYAVRPPGELLPPANSSWPMFRANVRHTGRVEK